MESTKQAEGNAAAAQACCAPAGKSGWLSSRNILIGAAVLGGGGALYFGGWSWLVAAGLAPIILGVLPCLAMCALGLCANRMAKKEPAPSTTAALPPKEVNVQGSVAPGSAELSPLPAATTANQAASEAANRAT